VKRYEHTEAERRIRRALSNMPYGVSVSAHAAKVGFRHNEPAPIELDDVAAYLEALAETLMDAARRIADERASVQQISDDFAAFRRLIGVGK